MKTKLLLILFLFVSLGLTAQETNLTKLMQDRNEYYFTFKLTGNDNLKQIANTISIDRVDGNVVTAYANNKQFADFQKLGYEVTLQTPPSMLENHVMWDGSDRANYDWDAYPTYSAYENMMYQFATDHPDKCEIINLGTLPSGRKILIAHINNGSGAGKPKFLYTSTIHGDETTGWMLMLRMIDYILENPMLQECQDVLENIDLYVGPNTNPDGTYHGGNNSVNGATRYNANGVDMNRNYADPHEGPHPDGNQYASETEWLMQFAQDNNFVMGANYHGGAEVMNYPWDNTYTLHADDAWYQLISHEYADLCHAINSSYMTEYNNGVTNGAQWYMIGGGRQDYMNGYAQSRELTIECSDIKCPSASQMPSFWNINRNSIFAYMNQCRYGIHGTAVDAVSNAPIGGALVTLVGHDDQYSSVMTQFPSGDFHRPVKAGTYNVRISKTGYQTYETQIALVDYETVTINANLVPLEGIIADFTADATAISIGESVHYTDDSWDNNGITGWSWEFEGGTPATSSTQNPTVIYNSAGYFGVRLTVTNANGESDTKYIPNYISVVSAYNMHTGTVSTCDAMFYDDGGPNANYNDNKDYTMTFNPEIPGNMIQVEFQSFELEETYDHLYIYDGTSTSATLIGNYTGNNFPGTVTATNTAGALTFRFTSDYNVNRFGWVAHVSCVGGPVVDPLTVTASVEHATVCSDGAENRLIASAIGGLGGYTYSWSPVNNLDNPTSPTPLFTSTYPGSYTFTVTVSDGLSTATASVSFEVVDCTGVGENEIGNISVYPNPASTTLNIIGLGEFTALEVSVVNLQGQVLTRVYNSLEINLKDIESGIYFLNINCDGQKTVRRIVVE